MAGNGSLISLHSHENKEILDKITQKDKGILDDLVVTEAGKLSFRGEVFSVDNEVFAGLSVKDNKLYFRGEMVCEDYESLSIKIMIDDVWDAIEEIENVGGKSDDTEQSEGSSDTE